MPGRLYKFYGERKYTGIILKYSWLKDLLMLKSKILVIMLKATLSFDKIAKSES